MSDEMKTALLGAAKITPPESSRRVSDALEALGSLRVPSAPIAVEIIARQRRKLAGDQAVRLPFLAAKITARRWRKGK